MFDTYSILIVVALVISLVSLRYRHILFALAGSIGWLALWRFHLGNPPAGIVIGDTTHEWLTYAYIAMAIGVLILYMANRSRGYTGYTRTKWEESELEERHARSRPARGLMDLSPEEYKKTISRRVNKRRR